jgi:hypothetical protein
LSGFERKKYQTLTHRQRQLEIADRQNTSNYRHRSWFVENLKSCMASSEQTVLLRQLTLTGKNREAFENCRAIPNNERHCQALYLNANGAVRECMNQKGYIFSNLDFHADHKENPYKIGDVIKGGAELKDGVCSWQQYPDPECYHNAWLFKITHWWAFN